MRNLSASLFGIAMLAACGGGGGGEKPVDGPIIVADAPIDTPEIPDAAIDAPPPQYDFSCMGNQAPTQAPNPVTIAGTASDINASFMLEGVGGAAVVAKTNANDQTVGQPTTTSSAQGTKGDWSLSLPTNMMPVDGYIEASKAGSRTVRLYPAGPISENLAMAPILLLSNANFALVLQFSGKSQSAANGTIGLVVTDCANTIVEGATISVKQGNNEVGMQFDLSQFQAGAFLVFDVPPGDTTVSATYNNMTFRSHVVKSVAQVTSTTQVRPGF